MKVKTRFAPSPTGHLHLGGARTALYSWLYAKNLGGTFVLRIEDTDQERSTQEATNAIINAMKWLNINWDEGPYFQTKRIDLYQNIIDDMLKKGTAYLCYCSKERLDMLRTNQISKGQKYRYDGFCRNKNKRYMINKPSVVRFRNPKNGSVLFNDLIRGPIKFRNEELDDLIIRRTDGSPTYNFCVVIDDLEMEISHVIRGEDHINNTPRQINILNSLDAPIPEYAHVSMILGSDGKKLSKRHGAVSVMQYREEGFLPEAVLNYLVRMGWSDGNQEIFSVDEMKEKFQLNAINKSPSIFNAKKLLWLNHYYINNLPEKYVATHMLWHFKKYNINIDVGPKPENLVKLVGKRCKTLKEILKTYYYFYQDFSEIDKDTIQNHLNPVDAKPLEIVRKKLALLSIWTIKEIEQAVIVTVKKLGISIKNINMPLRIAITGRTGSPSLYETIYYIGQSRTLFRIDMALIIINKKIK